MRCRLLRAGGTLQIRTWSKSTTDAKVLLYTTLSKEKRKYFLDLEHQHYLTTYVVVMTKALDPFPFPSSKTDWIQ